MAISDSPAAPMGSHVRLSQRIRWIRVSSGLTQKDFAERIGVSRSYLSEVEGEKGKPSIEMVIGIANSFPDIRPEWLLTGKTPFKKVGGDGGEEGTPQIDREALTSAMQFLGQIIDRQNANPSIETQSTFLSILYNTYMGAYIRSKNSGEEERSARNFGKYHCGIVSDALDPCSLGTDFAIGTPIPIFPEPGDQTDDK